MLKRPHNIPFLNPIKSYNMTESWTIFNALKTVVKRVPRRFLKDPNFLWIVYQIVKQWKPTRQIWGKEIINSHCPGGRLLWFSNNWFGSDMEVIWLPASGYWWDGDAGPSLARSTVKAYTEQSEKDCGVLSPLWCWRLNNTDSKDGTQALMSIFADVVMITSEGGGVW